MNLLPNTLSNIGILSELTTSESTQLASYGEFVHHDKGATVVAQDLEQSFMHLVLEGELDVKILGTDAIVPLGYVQPGGCVGEMSLLEAVEASAQVTATAPTNVWCLSRSQFDKFSTDCPTVANKVLRAIAILLASRLRKGSQRLLNEV